MDGATLSRLDGANKFGDSLVHFMTQEMKQAKLADFFSCQIMCGGSSRRVSYFPCFEEQSGKLPLVTILESSQ